MFLRTCSSETNMPRSARQVPAAGGRPSTASARRSLHVKDADPGPAHAELGRWARGEGQNGSMRVKGPRVGGLFNLPNTVNHERLSLLP